ncbi:unnamed protein product [Mytilus coruscus]|uniref:Sushi domain-containing protein n=1 Tax=Mytilus coruscus TaxID=42192 RepID=A0A6J8DJ60_MYTCO|nr:unnamed protein product [Mytilus coruscus]
MYFVDANTTSIAVSKGEGEIFPQTGQHVTRNEDNTNHEVTLPSKIKFPFMGTIYKKLYVSKDGLVGFTPGTLHQTEIFTDTLTQGDPAFVAPYYFPAQDIGSNLNGKPYTGQVLYREGSDVPLGELSNYSSIIQESMVGLEYQFEALYALVVTWKEVISKKNVLDSCNPCKNNTFQLAMLTDGTLSFAIFNYVKMDIVMDKFTQSGFNAGEGRGYTTALNADKLKYNWNTYGSGSKGMYIFRIDREKIQYGGCSTETRGVLNIYPTFAGMLGGRMLDISGPCMQLNELSTHVKCRFGEDNNLVTYGYKINSMKARCSVPRMSVRGWVSVEMSVNNRQYSHKTKILIVHPVRVSKGEKLHLPYMGKGQGWNETRTTQLTLQWNSSLLTDNENANVNISLMGYKENNNGITWANLRSIGTVRASAGQLTFQTNDINCIGPVCDEYEIGIVMAELQDIKQAKFYRFIVSKVIALGFFVNNAMVMNLGDNWPSQKCKTWYDQDRQDTSWLNKVVRCPCTLVQALSDIGNFLLILDVTFMIIEPVNVDTTRDLFIVCDLLNLRIQTGAGNQCCYDAGGNLRYSSDSFQGSTPDRSHAGGAYPYGKTGLVPDMSHWVRDVVTFYQCCLWNENRDCDYYMDQRSTRDCKGYNPPTPAMVFGQGHIETFDGIHQRMCGHGDFLLMNTTLPDTSVVTVQGRFYENVFPKIVGERGNTSVMLTNVGIRVVRGSTTETVEIRLKLPTADRSGRYLDVLVNQQYRFFDNKPSYWQDFKSFMVVNTDETGMGSNFTVILKDGLAIQVADCDRTLCVVVIAPPSLQGKVQGLLGNFNGNATDDLLNVNYTVTAQIDNNSLDDLTLYQMFKYPWAAQKKDSVLPMYVDPSYDPPICSVEQPKRLALQECNNNKPCMFDYRATGDREIAMKTKSKSMRINELRRFLSPVRTCGLLDIPRSVKSNTNYKLGQTVTIKSCRLGNLQGDDKSYRCSATSETSQTWSPSVNAKCSVMTPVKENIDRLLTRLQMETMSTVQITVDHTTQLEYLLMRERSNELGRNTADRDSNKHYVFGVLMFRAD